MNIGSELKQSLHTSVLLVALGICQVCIANDEAWVPAKEADGIKVYTRPVPNSALREFRGEIELDARPDQVVATLKDVSSFQKWMPDVVTAEMLRSSDTEQYQYIENAAPWPVANRDGVYRVTWTRGAIARTLHIEAVPDYLPAKPGKIRITKTAGSWMILPKGTGAELIYQMHADPGGSIPVWLANRAVVDTPFNTLKNLRRYLQSSTE